MTILPILMSILSIFVTILAILVTVLTILETILTILVTILTILLTILTTLVKYLTKLVKKNQLWMGGMGFSWGRHALWILGWVLRLGWFQFEFSIFDRSLGFLQAQRLLT